MEIFHKGVGIDVTKQVALFLLDSILKVSYPVFLSDSNRKRVVIMLAFHVAEQFEERGWADSYRTHDDASEQQAVTWLQLTRRWTVYDDMYTLLLQSRWEKVQEVATNRRQLD